MILEEREKEFKQIVGHRLVSLVMYTVKHNAAEVLDKVNEEIEYIKTTAKTYFAD